MKHKFIFFLIACLVQMLFFAILWLLENWQLSVFLSYEVAFFSVVLVLCCSYLHYKKNILFQAKHYRIQKPLLMIFIKKYEFLPKIIQFRKINDDLNFNEKLRNFSLFFSFSKMFAYGILIAGFLFLQHRALLSIFGYLCGVSSLLVCVFIFILYVSYECKKNH